VTGSGSVEIDYVEAIGACLRPLLGHRERVGRVSGAAVEVALREAHDVTVEDVERWVELHAAATQTETKFASRRRPSSDDFSGWN